MTMFERMPRALLWAAVGHALLSIVCLIALLRESAPILGIHPAMKPLKFAVSIALFLATMGVLLPSLAMSNPQRSALSWLFGSTMVVESGAIVTQALRGTTSHFNESTWFDATAWKLMVIAIVVATLAMSWVTLTATFGAMSDARGLDMDPLLAFAWRAGLWLLMMVPLSGFAMGGRKRHSVGGDDGGPGLPFVNFGVEHGDLRVAHFIGLHGIQLLPLTAWLLLRLDISSVVRTALFVAVACLTGGLCVVTLFQAFRGRPFLAIGP